MKTIYLTLFLSLITVMHASNPDDSTYPTAERLFHIARSLNKNLVCYDVNLENGKLNTKVPLNIYWVNREERVGETNELSYFQRKMAYGYKLVSEGNQRSDPDRLLRQEADNLQKRFQICLHDNDRQPTGHTRIALRKRQAQ